MSSAASRNLEIFDNPNPKRDYLIHMEIPEFTCLCPLTGQPDFATLILDYIPDEKNLELKALKLYMWSFRNEGHFHEDITNRILDDFVEAVNPRFMRLEARWWVRGGIYTTAVPLLYNPAARFAKEGTSQFKILTIVLGLVGLFVGLFLPFRVLVNIIYVLNGYLGAVLIIFMVWKNIKDLMAKKKA